MRADTRQTKTRHHRPKLRMHVRRPKAKGEGTMSVLGANAPPQIFKNSSFDLNFIIYAPFLTSICTHKTSAPLFNLL